MDSSTSTSIDLTKLFQESFTLYQIAWKELSLIGLCLLAFSTMSSFIPYLGVIINVMATLLVIQFLFHYIRRIDQGVHGTLSAEIHLFDYNDFLPCLVYYILSTLIITVGLLLVLIPGVYFYISYFFTFPIILFEKRGPWESMELSRKVVGKNFFLFFWIIMAITVLGILGSIPLGLGLIFVIPYGICVMYKTYKDYLSHETLLGLPE